MSIFDKRVKLKPYEYPELIGFSDSISHAYWLVDEFNFTKDIQDFKTELNTHERLVIERAMLAISQIEVNVKVYWSNLYNRMPKPEVGIVGACFGDSEQRHLQAYSKLLEVLSLNDNFENLMGIPEIQGRIEYLDKYMAGTKSRDNKEFVKSLILFSIFTENVSLFSQFITISSFNKERNLLKGINNVIDATSAEEQIHGKFGMYIVNICRKEFPEWFDEDMEVYIYKACRKAFVAESGIIEWIFDGKDLNFLTRKEVLEYIKNRFNNSLLEIGYDKIFETDSKLLEKTKWFDIQLLSNKEDDFFNKKSSSYNKFSKSIDEDSLF